MSRSFHDSFIVRPALVNVTVPRMECPTSSASVRGPKMARVHTTSSSLRSFFLSIWLADRPSSW